MNRDERGPVDASIARMLRWGAAWALAAAAVIAGCGGGVGVGGTGAYAAGPITGFGSIIVNGIEFDDGSARVEDEDGGGSDRSRLRLGMVVEVESGPIGGSASAPTATATRIRFASEIVGPVDSVNVAGSTLAVLGQTIVVRPTTVFDDGFVDGLAGIAAGTRVEVYGFFDPASGRFTATRIEPRAGGLAAYRLRGVVAGLDRNNRSFALGGLVLGYGALPLPAGFDNGSLVRVQVETTPLNGQWRVISFGEGVRRLPDLEDAHLRGPVTAFVSSRQFSVDGHPVDAAAASFPDGEAGVVAGARVEVEGAVVGGVLRARTVEIDDDGGPQGGFRLIGSIESHQPAAQTFVLRRTTVFYGGSDVDYEDGSAADIAAGVAVEVRGALSADGTRLEATEIRFRR